jgi:hypothetical protein
MSEKKFNPDNPEKDNFQAFAPELKRKYERIKDAEEIPFNEIKINDRLEIQTKSTLYQIEKIGPDEFTISGHKRICPKPIRCKILGSSLGDSASGIYINGIKDGLPMVFFLEVEGGSENQKPRFKEYKTSSVRRIRHISEDKKDSEPY